MKRNNRGCNAGYREKFFFAGKTAFEMSHRPSGLLAAIVFLFSCTSPIAEKEKESKQTEVHPVMADSAMTDSLAEEKTAEAPKPVSALEQQLIDSGLVNIRILDSTIAVDLRYSTENNFLGKDVYGELSDCYLQPEVAEKLANAQQLLKKEFPGYRLLVFDGVRPRSIQWKMWEMLDMPVKEKVKYVSNPESGSLHNFGAAVDVSIADENGNELDMGTPFDFFGELAYPVKEKDLLEKGELTLQQVENRRLLRKVMHHSGFFNIQTEWWHFNSCYRKEAAGRYPLIE